MGADQTRPGERGWAGVQFRDYDRHRWRRHLPEAALTGLVAHELAYVALDHSCSVANVAAGRFVLAQFHGRVGVVTFAPRARVPAILRIGLTASAHCCEDSFRRCYALSRDNYPCEVEVDALVVERGLGPQLLAPLRMQGNCEKRHGFWDWLLRTHPPRAKRLRLAGGDILDVQDAG
jgi:hypothetical protein